MPDVGAWRLGLGVGVVLATIATLCLVFGVAATFKWMLWAALAGAGLIALVLLIAAALALFTLK